MYKAKHISAHNPVRIITAYDMLASGLQYLAVRFAIAMLYFVDLINMELSFVLERNLEIESQYFLIDVLLSKIDGKDIILHNAIVQNGEALKDSDLEHNRKVMTWYRVSILGDTFIKGGEVVLQVGYDFWWGQTVPFDLMNNELLKQVELDFIEQEIDILESRRNEILGIEPEKFEFPDLGEFTDAFPAPLEWKQFRRIRKSPPWPKQNNSGK